MRAFASYFYMRACEIALKSEKPVWLGYEGDGRRGKQNGVVTDKGVNGHGAVGAAHRPRNDDPKTHWQQFFLGITYFFAFRLNLGWSDSLASPALVAPYRPERRGTLLLRYATRAIGYYVLWDLSLGLMEDAPTFRTFARRAEGSVWEPIVWAGGQVVLPPLVSAVYLTLL